ncbi:MAG: endonuclease domain-containing protein [Patescibacteria group bacterium]|jgi:very-short-patch-repair endonuclease|nr:endonuclease domain-containing protein [Patescibacteria group bacterium]
MASFYNQKRQKSTRQRLRNNMTQAEINLWKKLRNSSAGYKFRRQHGVGKYIVDFYCPKLNLIVELEGDVHGLDKQVRKDMKRFKFFEERGFNIKRYTNKDVLNNLDDVLDDLYYFCKKLDLG